MSDLPPEYLDSRTPPDVIVQGKAAPPYRDATLGVMLGPPAGGVPAVPADPAHPLVTLGDSLTHGVSSGAVFRTKLSWPALVAVAIGADDFKVPAYGGPLSGLPVNLEALARQLEKRFGGDINIVETLQVPLTLQRLLDKNEDYWERGTGSAVPPTDVRYQNLGIYGWDVRDALSYSAARATAHVQQDPDDQFVGFKPDHDNDIAARSVLAPFGIDATQVDAAAWHGRNGGIDALVVALGSNNALNAVVNKKVVWTGEGYDDLDRKGTYTVWTPTHFAAEYGALVARVRTIPARRVVLATVPHVTIAPIAKGVNPGRPGQKWKDGSRYFPYYTDPWIDEEDFRPGKHRHITHQQARAIDAAIDQYNATIAAAVQHARGEGRDWLLADLCGLLDGLAYRRYEADPAAAEANDWQPHPVPQAIKHLDARFFISDHRGRRQGGLFSLDGIHPTTSGYGLLAQVALDVLSVAGVPSKDINFSALLARDTLNSKPPALVAQALKLMAPFATYFASRKK